MKHTFLLLFFYLPSYSVLQDLQALLETLERKDLKALVMVVIQVGSSV